jgi:hypothetical protein
MTDLLGPIPQTKTSKHYTSYQHQKYSLRLLRKVSAFSRLSMEMEADMLRLYYVVWHQQVQSGNEKAV